MPETAASQFQSMVHGLLATTDGSLRSIAKAAGVSPTTISRAKCGDAHNPSAEVFHRVERLWTEAGKPVVN